MLIVVLVSLFGCTREFDSNIRLSDLYKSIGSGISTDVLEDRSKSDSIMFSSFEKTMFENNETNPQPSIYPLVLFDGKMSDGYLIWTVKEDVSGLYFFRGTLKIWKDNGRLVIKSPDGISDNFLEWHIQNGIQQVDTGNGTP